MLSTIRDFFNLILIFSTLIHNVTTKPLAVISAGPFYHFKMENVSSPVTSLGFIPTFSANQESDGDKTSFETAASSVNCFAEVVVTQNYSDISRYVFLYLSMSGICSLAKL